MKYTNYLNNNIYRLHNCCEIIKWDTKLYALVSTIQRNLGMIPLPQDHHIYYFWNDNALQISLPAWNRLIKSLSEYWRHTSIIASQITSIDASEKGIIIDLDNDGQPIQHQAIIAVDSV